MQTSHFVNKRLHDDDSHDREKDFVLLNFVNFKYHKTLVQQVELLIRIQQIIIFSTTVVWSQYIQKVSEIEILLAVMLLLQYSTELSLYELVESIKRRNQFIVLLYLSRNRLTAIERATSSARVMTSVSLFQSDMISVLMDSFFSRSKTLSSVKNGLKAIGRFSL